MNKDTKTKSFAIVADHDDKTIYVYRTSVDFLAIDVHLRSGGSENFLSIISESDFFENTEHEEDHFNKELFYLENQSKETIEKIAMGAMKDNVKNYASFESESEKAQKLIAEDLEEISKYVVDTTIRDFKDSEHYKVKSTGWINKWYASDCIMWRDCN